jgi:hypothetical protein
MGDSAGAALVILLGLAALVAGFVFGVLLYRLDRRERGEVLSPQEPRDAAAAPQDERRRHAA